MRPALLGFFLLALYICSSYFHLHHVSFLCLHNECFVTTEVPQLRCANPLFTMAVFVDENFYILQRAFRN